MNTRSIELIIAADEPALFFESVAFAEGYLEAIDVREGLFGPAYGRAGEVYRISVIDEYDVKITRDSSQPDDPAGLKQLLEKFLQGVEWAQELEPGSISEGELEILLQRCTPYLPPEPGPTPRWVKPLLYGCAVVLMAWVFWPTR